MSLRQHLRAWAAHAALNLGVALEALYHAVLPPQVDHAAEDIDHLSGMGLGEAFCEGLGLSTETP